MSGALPETLRHSPLTLLVCWLLLQGPVCRARILLTNTNTRGADCFTNTNRESPACTLRVPGPLGPAGSPACCNVSSHV